VTRSSSPTWLPLAAVGCTLVLWASAFVAIRHLGHDFSAGALSLGRLLVASICLGVAAVSTSSSTGQRLPHPTRREWLMLLTIGVLWFGIYNLALNQGERQVDAGTAAMLIQVSPVLIAFLAAVFLRERFTAYLAAGLTLAFAGVALIALSPSHSSAGNQPGGSHVVGVLLCLVSAVVYSISLILQKPLVARLKAVHVTWLACSVGAIVCLPFAGQLVHQMGEAPASSSWWLVYLGVFPTAIAFTTYAFALQHMDASSLGVTTYLVPPITIVLGLVFLGEAPPALAYVGGVLALVGVAVARRRPVHRDVSPAAPPAAEPGLATAGPDPGAR
jgi:drug/metabolite transporter (DMT)-like permease